MIRPLLTVLPLLGAAGCDRPRNDSLDAAQAVALLQRYQLLSKERA